MNNRLRNLRNKNNLTLKEQTKKLNEIGIKITSDGLSKYERGEREPKLETWQKLADFFGVSVAYLQGTEPDWQEITPETKQTIFELLNYYYFDGLNFKDPKNLNQVNELTSAVNRYIQLSSIKKYPLNVFVEIIQSNFEFLTSEDKKNIENNNWNALNPEYYWNKKLLDYWQKYFSFLFKDKKLIIAINKYLAEIENKNNYYNNDDIYLLMSSCINKYISTNFSSKLGKKLVNLYQQELKYHFENFLYELSIVESDNDIETTFDNYEGLMDDLKSYIIYHNNHLSS